MNRYTASFGTFLNTMNGLPNDPGRSALSVDKGAESPLPLSILDFVNKHGGSVSTLDLLAGVNLPIGTVANTLESLKNTNLVELNSTEGTENISLTDIGKAVVNFAQNLPKSE